MTASTMPPRNQTFNDDDRRVLNQIPIILENLADKLRSLFTLTSELEQSKAERSEVGEMEKRVIDRIDMLQEDVESIEKIKANRSESSKDLVAIHESRLKALEAVTFNLPQMAITVSQLRDWRMRTVAWAAGASAIVMAVLGLVEFLLIARRNG